MGHKARPVKGPHESSEFVPPRMTEQERQHFVRRYCDGAITTMRDVVGTDGDMSNVSMVFLPIAFGALKGWTKAAIELIGTIYEYDSRALPRSINGQPIFTSMSLIHVDDWIELVPLIAAEITRRDGVPREQQP